jgi:NAD(P)-dependent dehydrogenase (short-subunit alcohol dehydrogenase family)
VTEPTVRELFSLDGRVAVVTGGSKGLGKSMALALAESGARTVLVSRHLAEGTAAAAEIAAATGRESVALSADVTREEDVTRLFANVSARFGRIDVLINNAGVNIRHPIEEYPTEEFRQVIDVNLTGAWLCCRAVAPILKAAKSGSVINLGSALSAISLPDRSAYAAAKAGILGLTRTLALEWAPFRARCNALCPGPFLTEMNRPLLKTPEKAQAILSQTAFNRWAELHEIRGAAVFLASDASSYVTGSALYVDGGWTAR